MKIYDVRTEDKWYKLDNNRQAVFTDVVVSDYVYKHFDEFKLGWLESANASKILRLETCKFARFRHYSAIHGYTNVIRIGAVYSWKDR